MNDEDPTQQEELSCKEWYDFMGQFADRLPHMHLGGSEATRTLLEMCELGDELQVLDVGSGPGHTACELARVYNAQVIGIDISEQMVSKAEARCSKQGLERSVKFQVADAIQLPFENDYFDLILFESVLTAIEDKNLAMKEAFRVIKPGGQVAANETVFDESAPPELLDLLIDYPSIKGHLTSETLRGLFEETGFHVLEMKEVRGSEVPSSTKDMGIRGILSFIIRSYWKILWKLITDSRYRRAQKIDGQITKMLKEHGGYTLIVGKKP